MFDFDDRYAGDPISQMKPRYAPVERETVEAAQGLVVEHSQSEWCGAIVSIRQGFIELEDYAGKVRTFALNDAFMIDGKPVTLVLPKTPKAGRARTASGSFAVADARAKVARPSRIFVEGKHDAELVQRVWGQDLAHEGVVVELLDGADNLLHVLDEFHPVADARAGILLDHLVTGSKETRIADSVRQRPYAQFVRITGHPFVDIWQAIKPARVGLEKWPDIPRSEDIKAGTLKRLGLPYAEQADIADGWQRILGRVRGYGDLEPTLIGRVEELIDFVTTGRH